MLAGKDGRATHHYKVANIVATEGAHLAHLQALSPEERADIAFVMDARDMSLALKDMRHKGLELQVIYHSHPHSPARPSLTDIKIATEFEATRVVLNLPEPLHFIISLEKKDTQAAAAFRIANGTVTPVSYQTL